MTYQYVRQKITKSCCNPFKKKRSRNRLLWIVTVILLITGIKYYRHPSENRHVEETSEDSSHTLPQPLHCVPDVPCSYPESVDLRVIVIVYDRAESMLKLLHSLDKLILDGASASLEIWIDRSKHKDEVHAQTLEAAQQFRWSKGATRVHIQERHVGIYGQWIDTWKPKNATNELALILEDDITVSPYAWRWLRAVHQRFGSRTDILGYTVENDKRLSTAIGRHPPLLKVDASQNVFLYRHLGSWGFSPHPAVWADFQTWYHKVRKDPAFKPYIGGGVMFDDWYKKFEKSGTADSMWTQWFIKYTNDRNLYCVYNNLVEYSGKRQATLAVHREEKGLHFPLKVFRANINEEKDLLVTWEDSYVLFAKKVQRFEFNGHMSLVNI